jgi:phosphohistidine phosphatase SixA
VNIFVMRHGPAGLASTDSDREKWRGLTDGGREVVLAVAREMLEQGEVPNFIVCSSYSRTCETAKILGQILGVSVDELDELTPNMPIRPVVEAFLADDNAKRVMIVGHTDNIDPFLEAETGDDEKLAKGEVRRYDFDRAGEGAEEKWRLLPSDLGFVDEYDTPLAGTEAAAEMGYVAPYR